MKLNNLNNRVKEFHNIKKNFFVIDIDSLDKENLLRVYASILSYFYDNEGNIIQELKYNDLVRIHYSSSKTGFHVKVNVPNNIMENFYYRAIWGDDLYRLQNDIIRLNHDSTCYDVAFSTKMKEHGIQTKDFKHINPLEYFGITMQDFLLLVFSNRNRKFDIIEDIFKKYNLKDKKKDLSQEHKDRMNRLLLKYSKTNESGDLVVKDKEKLIKAMYYYSVNNLK